MANQQIEFDPIAAANPSLQFSLTGPNGYTAFSGANASSGILSLPASGMYTLTAGGDNRAYAFELIETSQLRLNLATQYQGMLAGVGRAQFFVVTVPSIEALLINLQDSSAVDQNEVYASFGAPPTRADYQYRRS